MDAPLVSIPTKGYATLVAPKKLKGMKVLQDILLYLAKLPFEYSYTSKLGSLDRKNYMKLVRDTPKLPNNFVPIRWENILEQLRLLSILFMLHFG